MVHATSYLGQLTCFGSFIPALQTFSHPLPAVQHTGLGDQIRGSLYKLRPPTDTYWTPGGQTTSAYQSWPTLVR